jgi:hypothetical protein
MSSVYLLLIRNYIYLILWVYMTTLVFLIYVSSMQSLDNALTFVLGETNST